MPQGITQKATMVVPEVMADMVSAKLPKLIKFTPLAYVDNTLVGQPGDKITVPKWEYVWRCSRSCRRCSHHFGSIDY